MFSLQITEFGMEFLYQIINVSILHLAAYLQISKERRTKAQCFSSKGNKGRGAFVMGGGAFVGRIYRQTRAAEESKSAFEAHIKTMIYVQI